MSLSGEVVKVTSYYYIILKVSDNHDIYIVVKSAN